MCVERIEGLTGSLAYPHAGTLNASIAPSFGTTVVSLSVTALIKRMPKETVNIEPLVPHLLPEALVDGAADVAVSLSPREHASLKMVRRHPCRLVYV